MGKETNYQDLGQKFIESISEQYSGKKLVIYEEEFATQYNDVLQEGTYSPLIAGDNGLNSANAKFLTDTYGIVGLRHFILQFNQQDITKFCQNNKITLTTNQVVELMLENFHSLYRTAQNVAELYQLIFAKNQDISNPSKQRKIHFSGVKEPLSYNVIYYEDSVSYQGKNAFYTIRERRIPVSQRTERPDFLTYINGIPLVLVEYKTEDSGLLESIKDYDTKESYKCAPFKVALNDGSSVLFFTQLESLKFKSGKQNAFLWKYYHAEKKHLHNREYSDIEYFFDELICQPQNLYNYCANCCSVVDDGHNYYLINARIQQYYALKDVNTTLVNISANNLTLPYNYEFAHAQRSGKTITMKLIVYLISRQYHNIFNTIFLYVPDLQIKKVLRTEFAKRGSTNAIITEIETRKAYVEAVQELVKEENNGKEPRSTLKVYIVNMQKITSEDYLLNLQVKSDKVLNIIDEAHHGQTKEMATNRDKVFPSASNYLFTATGKEEMYSYYFPDNDGKNFRNVFTISHAKECGITVPVSFLQAKRTFTLSPKLKYVTEQIETTVKSVFESQASAFGAEDADIEKALELSNGVVQRDFKKRLHQDTMLDKVKYIATFLDEVRKTIKFTPKAIVYVDSVANAKKYIEIIQQQGTNNEFLGYRWGCDFSGLDNISCPKYNIGITNPDDISVKFEMSRDLDTNKSNNLIIDILFAVDKYQKGFDLPALLVTYLDCTIQEPARMNQIYTRTATKHPSKLLGYCVDLSLDEQNAETFTTSLELYDKGTIGDNFIDQSKIDEIRVLLTQYFTKIKMVLGLSGGDFTSNNILQKVLNEVDLSLRQKRQHEFFTTAKAIFRELAKIGSPLYYKPFGLEIKELYGAFKEFKEIYADKNHAENGKILINTDSSFADDDAFISSSEIKQIIHAVLMFVNASNINDLFNAQLTSETNEVARPEDLEKIKTNKQQEQQKNKLEETAQKLESYLKFNHRPLYESIRSMLFRMSEDRTLIYEEYFQVELAEKLKAMSAVENTIEQDITIKFNGNKLLFWITDSLRGVLNKYGIADDGFIAFCAQSLESALRVYAPRIGQNQSNYHKALELKQFYFEGEDITAFSNFVREYFNRLDKEQNTSAKDVLRQQILSATKINNEQFAVSKTPLEEVLMGALRNYFDE